MACSLWIWSEARAIEAVFGRPCVHFFEPLGRPRDAGGAAAPQLFFPLLEAEMHLGIEFSHNMRTED